MSRIYHDFQNVDSQGRLRLICAGTIEDLANNQIELRDGLVLSLYSDDVDAEGRLDELLLDGVVSFSNEEQCWIATVDWNATRHTSDGPANGDDAPVKSGKSEVVA
jgi:hypothetical protein